MKESIRKKTAMKNSSLKFLDKRLMAVIAVIGLSLPSFAQDAAENEIANKLIKESNEDVTLKKREAISKQQKELQADEAQIRAENAYKAADYELAIKEYESAISDFVKVSQTHPRLVEKVAFAKLATAKVHTEYANILTKEAKLSMKLNLFEKAVALLEKSVQYDARLDAFVASKIASMRADMKRAEFLAQVNPEEADQAEIELEKEKKWRLEQAQLLISNRRFSDAKEVLNEIFVLDPFDQKAAITMQRVNKLMFRAGKSRRIATVIERIDEVEWKWSMPIHSTIDSGSSRDTDLGKVPITSEKDIIMDKMKLIIPRFKMEKETIKEVIGRLRDLARDVDPAQIGINIIFRELEASAKVESVLEEAGDDEFDAEVDDFGEEEDTAVADVEESAGGKTYDFDFENMPLGEIIRYICVGSGLKYKVESNAVVIADAQVVIDEMVTRFYPVSSSVFNVLKETGERAGGLIDDDSVDVGGETSVEEYLKAMGVKFNAGAKVNYIEGVSRLVLTNTVTEQRRVQKILNELQVEAAQVIVESKFVEINQSNIEEFGFQWLLLHTGSMNERVNLNPNLSSQRVSDDGRTGEFTFDRMNSGLPINSIGPLSAVGNTDGLSSGIRSIVNAIPGGANLEAAAGALSFTTILGANQFNTIVRALSQQNNSDVLSAPKVITQNGSTAIIRVVEERYFPENWDPPTVNTIGSANGGGATIVIQPSIPTFGDPTDIGIVLEVTPQVDPDGMSIDLEMKPQVVEFVGLESRFNTPIVLLGIAAEGTGTTHIEARYDMPILSRRSVDTRVKIWDGETIVLGGLIRESVVAIDDRIPFLSDIPLLGRLFRNEGEHRQKTNLLIFVSARLVDNAGLPLRQSEVRGLPDFKRL